MIELNKLRKEPRAKRVHRLPQCNKANRIARRYYAGARYRVITKSPTVATAAAA